MKLLPKLANKLLFITYKQLIMKKFITGIVTGVRQEPDPTKTGWKYHCFEEMLLEHGAFLEPLPIDAAPRQGDQNVLATATRLDLVYTEGYAIPSLAELPVPVLHAWATTKEGRAVEATWEKPGSCYFGILFKREWVQRLIQARIAEGQNSVKVLDYNCWDSLALLKSGIPADALDKNRLFFLINKHFIFWNSLKAMEFLLNELQA